VLCASLRTMTNQLAGMRKRTLVVCLRPPPPPNGSALDTRQRFRSCGAFPEGGCRMCGATASPLWRTGPDHLRACATPNLASLPLAATLSRSVSGAVCDFESSACERLACPDRRHCPARRRGDAHEPHPASQRRRAGRPLHRSVRPLPSSCTRCTARCRASCSAAAARCRGS